MATNFVQLPLLVFTHIFVEPSVYTFLRKIEKRCKDMRPVNATGDYEEGLFHCFQHVDFLPCVNLQGLHFSVVCLLLWASGK